MAVIARREPQRFDGMKVFSSGSEPECDTVGEAATAWIDQHRELEIVEVTVMRSTAGSSRCVSIVIAYNRR